MSTEFDHSEFEKWLRTETDRHRLFPDESVWNRIQNRVHRRRWYPFVLSALFLVCGTMTWVMTDQPVLPINYAANKIAPAQKNNAGMPSTRPGTSGIIRNVSRSQADLTDATELPFLMQLEESRSDITGSKSDEAFGTISETDLLVAQQTEPIDQLLPLPSIQVERTKTDPTSIPALPAHNHLLTKQSPPIEEPVRTEPVQETLPTPAQTQRIEQVVDVQKGKQNRKKWSVQLSVIPTVSYRQLIENTSALQAARSVMSPAPALAAPELESVAIHKPDLGLQFGVALNRALTKRIDLVGGLQFNINKYDIRAYRGSQEVATVGLNNGGGTGSVSTFTPYRSSGGVWANWLANFYFSASAPIGFQYRVIGNRKWNWGIGSTLQPTYILSNQAYILSTDYKNYLEVPSLVRRWNLNGQVETFIGFQKGKTRWTLGPQARYQILSSYEKAYPVSEHLFDIGIKLGVGL